MGGFSVPAAYLGKVLVSDQEGSRQRGFLIGIVMGALSIKITL